MGLELCTDGLIRFFFIFLRTAWDYKGWVFTILLIAVIISLLLKRFSGIVSVIMDAITTATDLLADVTVETFIGSIGFAMLGAFLLGTYWVLMLFMSNANIILKVIGAPFFLLFGAILGAFPIPTPGITSAVGFGMKTNYSDIIIAIVIGLTLALPLILNLLIVILGSFISTGNLSSACNWLDSLSTIFV